MTRSEEAHWMIGEKSLRHTRRHKVSLDTSREVSKNTLHLKGNISHWYIEKCLLSVGKTQTI